MERIYLTDRDTVEVYENNLVTVRLASGEQTEALEPRRLFPINRLNEYITLLDEDGTERFVIRSLSDLDKDSRRVVSDSLNDFYLVPHIVRILSASEKYGTVHWTVETDRGVKSFDIRNRNHDIRVSADGSVRVRDSDDNRYIIEDYRALDRTSRAALIADL